MNIEEQYHSKSDSEIEENEEEAQIQTQGEGYNNNKSKLTNEISSLANKKEKNRQSENEDDVDNDEDNEYQEEDIEERDQIYRRQNTEQITTTQCQYNQEDDEEESEDGGKTLRIMRDQVEAEQEEKQFEESNRTEREDTDQISQEIKQNKNDELIEVKIDCAQNNDKNEIQQQVSFLDLGKEVKNENDSSNLNTNSQGNYEEVEIEISKNLQTQEQDENVKIQQIQKEKKPEVRPKIIYNPLEDFDNYPGEYSDSGEEESEMSENEEDSEEEDDNDDDEEVSKKNKKKQGTKKKGKKEVKQQKKVVKRKKQTLVLNVADTKYCVVKFVGKKIFGWDLQYQIDALDWDVCWTDNAVQPDQLGRMQPYQKINHFPGMFSLARKNHLARNLMKMRKFFPKDYAFFPQTWLLPAEYNDFKNHIERARHPHNTFIAKPEASCQGRGIFLTKTLDDFNQGDHYVVQKYLQNPFLIDGLKFDFRLYVLLAGCDPLRIYLYYEGLTRFATEPYKDPSRDNLENMCIHLTNYAINKDNPNFQFNSDQNKMDVGHKRSLTSVLQLLENMGHDVNKLWKDIKRVLVKTIISSQPTLAHHYKSCQPDNFANNMCFELLGFDIIIDNKLKPWLLEVNHTPSFVTDTPLDSFIKKNAIRDSLKLMNTNCKAKNEIVNSRKEIMLKRVLTGKKVKYSLEEKQEEIKKSQIKRDEHEDLNLGGYEKIYPIEDDEDDKFTEYIAHALKCYEESTGAHIRRNQKKVLEDPKKIPNISKLTQAKELDKIYKQKILVQSTPKKATGPPRCAPGYHQPPYPSKSEAINSNMGEDLRGEDDITDQTRQMSRSSSEQPFGFRIKKTSFSSPYSNVHNKFKNKISQNRVPLEMKELRLGEEQTQYDDPSTEKYCYPNQKKIQAYILTTEPHQKPLPEKIKKKSFSIIEKTQVSQNLQTLQVSPQISQASLQQILVNHQHQNVEQPLRRPQLPQQPTQKPPSSKLPFFAQLEQAVKIESMLTMNEERRQWLANAQRNLQYSLQKSLPLPQQPLKILNQKSNIPLSSSEIFNPKGINSLNNNNVVKEILATVGGSISGQQYQRGGDSLHFLKQKNPPTKDSAFINCIKYLKDSNNRSSNGNNINNNNPAVTASKRYIQSKTFDMPMNFSTTIGDTINNFDLFNPLTLKKNNLNQINNSNNNNHNHNQFGQFNDALYNKSNNNNMNMNMKNNKIYCLPYSKQI